MGGLIYQEKVCSAISSLIYSRLKIPHQLSGGYGSRLTPRSQGDGNAIYPGVEKKVVSEGVKPIESLPRIFCGLVIHIKNTFCKKIGSKRSFQPSAVVRAIYPPSIWGPSRQLDDQHRNTNMNNKDNHTF